MNKTMEYQMINCEELTDEITKIYYFETSVT